MRRVLVTAAILALFPGCTGTPEEREEDRFVRRAEEVRELSMNEPVLFERLTSDEYAAQIAASTEEIDDAELEEYRDTYGRLGYFPPETDLRADIAGSSSDWVAGIYFHDTKRIRIIGDPSDSVIVHELVHAVQDEHFSLAAFRDVPTTDEYMARRAVIEGDATLAQTRFGLQEKYDVDLDDLDWEDFFSYWAEASASTLTDSDYPVIFRAVPAFLYPYGAPYCANNLAGAHPAWGDDTLPFPFDWTREDALFLTRPPRSTKQVMTFDVESTVLAIGLADVPAELATSLEPVSWDTLGAWYSYLLFYPVNGAPFVDDARELSVHWNGDRVLFVRDTKTGEVGVAWSSIWDDPSAATRAFSALEQLHGFTPSSEVPEQGAAADGEPMRLERRDSRVLFLKNIDPAYSQVLADAAFEVSTAPKISPPPPRIPLPVRIAEQMPHL